MTNSRLPGLRHLAPADRLAAVAGAAGLPQAALASLAEGCPIARLDLLSEHVVGAFPLPLGVATHLRVDDADVLVPLATEESSVVAALSAAGKLLRGGAGIRTQADRARAQAQVVLEGVADPVAAARALAAETPALLALANQGHAALAAAGGGARGLTLAALPGLPGTAIATLTIDPGDAQGANLVTGMAQALRPRLEALTGGRTLAAIVANGGTARQARAWGRVPLADLGSQGADVGARIARLSRVAQADPARALTHDKGIWNGVEALLTALGQDTRAAGAAAWAHAFRHGRAEPWATWQVEDDALTGWIALPLALGTVGGATAAHPVARACRALLGDPDAAGLAGLAAAVGLAQNLAALRMLVTTGLGPGHLRLHATNLALAAGASEAELPALVAVLAGEPHPSETSARRHLDDIRRRAR